MAKDGTKTRILSVEPLEDWSTKTESFTAAAGTEGAERELWVTARCDGYQGLVVSDDEGWMRVEVQGVSVVRAI